MKDKKVSIFSGIAFFVFGLVIFLHPDFVVKFVSYFIGGLLIFIGLYKIANYIIQNKRLEVVNTNELSFGITALILGIVFLFLASAFELILRFIIGGWVLISGLNKVSYTFFTNDRTKNFYSLIIVGIIFILIGLYIIFVSNLAFSLIGLFMMVYGIIDIFSYFGLKKLTFDKRENKKKKNIDIIEAEVVEKDED